MNSGRRKLAALMFTDIVGYSSLSHKNESLALQIVQEHRTLLRPLFAKHSGHEIKTIGDAFFVEFTSASDAVACAIEAQELLHQRNRANPKKNAILVRIGIHLSDVIETDDTNYDIYGNGVNIAARLQTLAPHGGICFSEQVYDQVRGQLKYKVTNHGKKNLKNIDKPVTVYSIDFAPSAPLDLAPWAKRAAGAALAIILSVLGIRFYHQAYRSQFSNGQSTLQSGAVPANIANQRIAVLPFSNLSEHPDDEYLANGILEELISRLSNLTGFRVLARTSVMYYKNTKKSLREIGQELKVEIVLQGTIRRMGSSLKVSVQLTNARNQENIWSENFDGRVDDIFQIESAIASKIAGHFRTRTVAVAGVPIRDSIASVPHQDAYLTYLKGRYLLNRRTEESLLKSIELFKESIKRDPNYAPYYVGVTNAYHLMAFYGLLAPKEALKLELPFTERALALDAESPEALTARACRRIYYDRDYAAAEADFKKAISLRPSSLSTHHFYGEFLLAMGRIKEAQDQFEIAIELDPLSPVVHNALGLPKYFGGQYDKSVVHFKGVVEMDPHYPPAHFWLGQSYLSQKSYKSAVEVLTKAQGLVEFTPVLKSALGYAYAVSGERKKAESIINELQAMKSKRYISSYYLAKINAALGNNEMVFKNLEQALDENAINLVYLNVEPAFNGLRGDARFAAIKKKSGF
jgi:adenylate cyclase